MHPKILAGALDWKSCHHILLSCGQCSQLVKSINVSQRSAGTPGAEGSSPDPKQFVRTLQGCPSWMLWEGDGKVIVKVKWSHNSSRLLEAAPTTLCYSGNRDRFLQPTKAGKGLLQSPVQKHCVGMMTVSLSSGGLPGAMCMLGC